MASFVVKIPSLEQLLGQWVQVVSRECGEAHQHESDGVIQISWQQPYVPEGDDPDWVQRPRGKVIRREPPFIRYKTGLFESLEGERWARLQWYYYCDNDFGNTIRLYDAVHFHHERNSSRYLELENSGGNGKYTDRVLIRGENLEREKHALKRALRELFEEQWSASKAPIQARSVAGVQVHFPLHLRRPAVQTMSLGVEQFYKQHAYFQHECHNNMPDNDLDINEYL